MRKKSAPRYSRRRQYVGSCCYGGDEKGGGEEEADGSKDEEGDRGDEEGSRSGSRDQEGSRGDEELRKAAKGSLAYKSATAILPTSSSTKILEVILWRTCSTERGRRLRHSRR